MLDNVVKRAVGKFGGEMGQDEGSDLAAILFAMDREHIDELGTGGFGGMLVKEI